MLRRGLQSAHRVGSGLPRAYASVAGPTGMPTVATSRFLLGKREDALLTKDLVFLPEHSINAREDGVRVSADDLKERETKKLNLYQSVNDAMMTTLSKDPSSVLFGEDVFFGGVFRCSMGLSAYFGKERVFNTPLTEQGIVGFGIGLATMGQTAIAEIQFADYIFPAFDQIVNEAAKYRYRSGGREDVGGLTIRTPCMSIGHGALYHSQSPEAYFLQAAGVKVVVPRSPIQAKGLLLASIRDPNPVIFFEPKSLYRAAVEEVPVDDYELPLGKADVMQEGTDLTIISYGLPLYTVEQTLHLLKNSVNPEMDAITKPYKDLSVELIDLRTILPYDIDTLVKSVNKTGRCIVVHEAGRTGGVGGDVASEIQERCFLRLEAPVNRVTGWDAPVPLAYESFFIPDAIRVLDAITQTMEY